MASSDDSVVKSEAEAEDKASKYAAKFKGYVAKPEVKEVYAVMKTSAKAIDTTADVVTFLEKPGIKDVLSKNVPALSAKIEMIGKFAKALGPAGVALGFGVDLMVAFGLLEDCTMKQLNEISCLIKELSEDVKKGFEDIKKHLKIERALTRFLDIHDKVRTKVELYEETVVHEGIIDANVFYQLLEDMVTNYHPLDVIEDLEQMHRLMTGEAGFCDGKPLFEQLAEEGNDLQGEEVDQFISTLLFQFQMVVCLEIRAIRMLRSFIAFEEADVKYSERLKAIFKSVAQQISKNDPFKIYNWYFNFRTVGGTFLMSTTKWPNYYLYMTSFTGNVRASQGSHEGDQGVFIITPCNDGTYLISPKKWPQYYVSISTGRDIENPVGRFLGDSASKVDVPVTVGDLATLMLSRLSSFDVTGDDFRRDRWIITTKGISKRTFVVKDAQLKPDHYMYMRGDFTGSIRCYAGNPGDRGDFVLTPQLEPAVDWYLNFRAFGGFFVITTAAYPDRYLYIDSSGKVSGSKTTRQVFTIKPHDGGTFLIQASPDWYLYMKDNLSGNVMGRKRCLGLETYWCIDCNDVKKHTLLLSTAKWPRWHIYMRNDSIANIRSQNGDPGTKGHFILEPYN